MAGFGTRRAAVAAGLAAVVVLAGCGPAVELGGPAGRGWVQYDDGRRQLWRAVRRAAADAGPGSR